MPARRSSLPALRLSLQWGAFPEVPAHRAALPRHMVARCLRHALEQDAEITVRVVGQEEGLALNRRFRCKNHATNVLTFGYSARPVSADLVLCGPVVQQEAASQGISLQVHYAHLLVHGALHAQGYDHETGKTAAREMEALEARIMLGLGWGDPYQR
jgi:probable rRNA maturation factor